MSNHQIVRAFGHRGVELEKLCTESADGLHRLEETFQEFVKARWEQHGAEQTSKKWRFSVERERDALKNLQEEKLLWDSVLETKQKEVKDLKKVIKRDVEEFRKNCEMLCVKYEKFDEELDNETLTKEINRIKDRKKELETSIQEMELELQRINDLPNQEFVRTPGLKEMTEILEKESVEMFGKPHELKKKLKELQQNTNNLKKQIYKLEN